MTTIDPRIAAYVEEISKPGIPYVSYSHHTLLTMYIEHGKQVVDHLLPEHWAKQREQVPPALLRINKETNVNTNQ